MLDEIDSRLNLLELKCRRAVEHLLAGQYRSVFRGRGVEFEDTRLYQPGDDVRSMDWKVTARTGEAHIKRYIEEREQYIYLLVDVSASMLYDTPQRKRRTVVEICSLLTMAALKNHDRVGLVLFSDRIEHVVPPAKGRSHGMRIIDQLMHFQPEGTDTNIIEMLGYFGQMARKHSVAFVVSDFLTEDYVCELQALAFKHDINAIHIADSKLVSGAVHGLMRVEDAEAGVQRVVDLNAGTSEGGARRHYLQQQMLEAGVKLLNLDVGGDCVEALAKFFHDRQRLEIDETGG